MRLEVWSAVLTHPAPDPARELHGKRASGLAVRDVRGKIGGLAMGTKGLAWIGGLALAAALIAWAWNRAPQQPVSPLQAPIEGGSDAELSSAESAPMQEPAAREGVASAAPSALEPAPAAAGQELLYGIVVDWLDRPVEGAQICTLDVNESDPSRVLVLTDAAGRFELTHPLRGGLYARAAGYAPSTAQLLLAGAAPSELRLVLPGPGGIVQGVVLGPDGAPLPGARVRVGWPYDTPAPSAAGVPLMKAAGRRQLTDERGRFREEAVAYGEVGVRVHAQGLAEWKGSVRVGAEPVELRVSLEPGASVRGVVRDGNGQPVARARVGIENDWDFPDAQTNSAQDGSFELRDLPAGSRKFRARHESHPECIATLEVAPGAELRWNPVLSGARRVTGRVLSTGLSSFAEWWLEWQTEVGASGGRVPLEADGSFAFEFGLAKVQRLNFCAAPPNPKGGRGYEIAMSWPGVALDAGPIELRMPERWDQLGSVDGTLRVAEDDPARGAQPLLLRSDERGRVLTGVGGLSGKLDAQSGRFRFERVHLGRYALVLPAAPELGMLYLRFFEIAPGEQLDLGEIALPGNGTLRATLTIDAAPPAQPLTCSILAPEGEDPPRGFGWFNEGLPAELRLREGKYRLWVPANGQCFARWVPFEVRAGRETRLEIDLASRRALLVRVRPKAGVELPDEIALSVALHDLWRGAPEQAPIELRVPRVGSVYELSIEVRPASYHLRVAAGALGSLDRVHEAFGDELPELELQLE